MRVGTLNRVDAMRHATRLVSSLCVTATSMSASSAPACFSTEGCAAWPRTVRRSKRSCNSARRVGVEVDDGDVVVFGNQAFSQIAADLAGAEDDDFQARSLGLQVFVEATPVPDVQLFQLAVKVRALQP